MGMEEQNLQLRLRGHQNKIINGDFMPGSVLMERSIADEFGVSLRRCRR